MSVAFETTCDRCTCTVRASKRHGLKAAWRRHTITCGRKIR